MRLILLATGPFAVPTLESLLGSENSVAALVTRPVRTRVGRRRPPVSPLRALAEERGVEVLAPETINDAQACAAAAAFEPELTVVCDYGEILKPEAIAIARLGAINLHGSLLPKYRGAAPVQWAVYHGEAETGNTVFHLTPKLDAGPMLAQQRVAIDPDETAEQLEQRLARLGAEAVLQVVADLAAGRAEPIVQDATAATKAPRLKKSDGQLDWTRSALELKNQVRAFQPWPRCFTEWQLEGKPPLRLIVHRADICELDSPAPPGTILESHDRLVVATGDGALELVEVQPAGKRALTAVDFLHGHPIKPGEKLA